MINILIDGNFISFSEFAMFSNYGKTKDPLKRERDQAAFIQGLSSRLFYIINSLPKGGRVVFCLDSRSWRKDFMEKYKERREDGDGNKGIMDNETKQLFYNLLAEFGEVLTSVGIHMSKIQGAEGDDLLFKWAKYFNDKGENCIIISGDYDMTQTVRGPESPWTVVWSNKSSNNKMFAMPGWIDAIEEPQKNTIFEFNVVHDQSNLAKLIRDSGASLQVIDVNYYVLHKILIGDDGDDVPSSWKMKTTNSKGEEKIVRVTDKKAEKIIEIITYPPSDRSLDYKEWLNVILHAIDPKAKSILDYTKTNINIEERMDELSGVLLRVMGDVDDAKLRKQVTENILRNAKLVWLKEEMLPFNINEMINENIEKSMDSMTGVNRAKWNKTALLEGTRFGKMKVAPRGFDPFSLMDLPDEDIS
jgi:5'-3' exonuclease